MLSMRTELIFLALIFAQSAPRWAVPPQVHGCERLLPTGDAITSRLNPFYLRGDFDGDGRPDYAVLIARDNGPKGIMACLSSLRRPVVLGAGAPFGDMNDLDFDAWRVYPKGPIKRSEAAPPVLRGDAILMIWEERASALAYWDGKRFRWYQQGD